MKDKYLPFILIVAAVLVGGLLFLKKNALSLQLPGFLAGNKLSDGLKKSSVVEILFTGGNYDLTYTKLDPKNSVEITKLDKTEQWQGEGSIEDNSQVISGVVLSLVDRDHQKSDAYISKNLNLTGIDNIKLMVYLRTNPEDLETLNLIFSNKDATNYFRFPITNLTPGYNFISIPKSRFFLVDNQTETSKKSTSPASSGQISWDKIERVQFELISRPGAKANVEISTVHGEKDIDFGTEWNWDESNSFFNIGFSADGKPGLLVKSTGRGIATLRKVGSAKNFTYSSKITSLRRGSLGLFFRGDYRLGYGYYLTVGGLGTNTWSISKYGLYNDLPKTTILLDGQISNFDFSKDQPFWLKIEANGNNLGAFFSIDGKNFTKLGEVIDGEFNVGGVGIVVSGDAAGFFDEFHLVQK